MNVSYLSSPSSSLLTRDRNKLFSASTFSISANEMMSASSFRIISPNASSCSSGFGRSALSPNRL
jgi:hypothetical protein